MFQKGGIMTTNPYDPTPYDAGSSHAADTGTSSKKDVAAEQGLARLDRTDKRRKP